MLSQFASARPTQSIGVTVPVHDEERRLGQALESLTHAFSELDESNVLLRAAIVLDACRDHSVDIAMRWKRHVESSTRVRVRVLECDVENVGMARALGCGELLEECRESELSSLWLATSDADSRVPRRWLTTQLMWRNAGIDAWAGRVLVHDWADLRRATALRWQREYERERRPIHGANLGFAADRYFAVGGFLPLATGEDRALVKALLDDGATVHFDSLTRVATSSRHRARAPKGFASALRRIDDSFFASTARPSTSVALDDWAVG